MAADTGSCSDDSEDPWWWEEAAGYSTMGDDVCTTPIYASETSDDAIHYLHGERVESTYLSNLLRANPSDEWAEWRTTVTKMLMIPEEGEPQDMSRPVTPVNTIAEDAPSASRSPTRRRSLFNFSSITKKADFLTKRKSVLW